MVKRYQVIAEGVLILKNTLHVKLKNRGIIATMNQTAIVFLIALSLLFLGCDIKKELAQKSCDTEENSNKAFDIKEAEQQLQEFKRIVKETGSAKCCQKYIEHVIEHGSDVLHMKAGLMDGGYAYGEDIKKIASYVLTFSNRESIYPEHLQDGNMLYNGNCGGCHGDDGKGLGGAYPDLTIPLFIGAQLRKENYIQKIIELEHELLKAKNVQ